MSLEKLRRSKYDLGGKFGDAVNKVINPICIKVHKETESEKKRAFYSKSTQQVLKTESEIHLK